MLTRPCPHSPVPTDGQRQRRARLPGPSSLSGTATLASPHTSLLPPSFTSLHFTSLLFPQQAARHRHHKPLPSPWARPSPSRLARDWHLTQDKRRTPGHLAVCYFPALNPLGLHCPCTALLCNTPQRPARQCPAPREPREARPARQRDPRPGEARQRTHRTAWPRLAWPRLAWPRIALHCAALGRAMLPWVGTASLGLCGLHCLPPAWPGRECVALGRLGLQSFPRARLGMPYAGLHRICPLGTSSTAPFLT